jgi:hypothetical protein
MYDKHLERQNIHRHRIVRWEILAPKRKQIFVTKFLEQFGGGLANTTDLLMGRAQGVDSEPVNQEPEVGSLYNSLRKRTLDLIELTNLSNSK